MKQNLSKELYALVDRLEACSKINHPERPWSMDFYYEVAWQWRDKLPELKERVKSLESKLISN